MTIKDDTTDTTTSHKASPFGADVDPFSGVSMGSSDANPASGVSNPNYPVSSSEAVGKYGTAYPTTGATVSTTPIVASGYPPAANNGYQLLEGVSIDRLPPQFRRMLLSPSASQNNQGATVEVGFDYYRTSIPTRPLFILLYHLIGGGVFILVCVFGAKVPLDIFTVVIGACVGIVGITHGVRAAIVSKRKRDSLYITGSDGKRKFCKKHWKGGVYLVGSEALIHYDGFRAWCFPVDTILRVEVPHEADGNWHSSSDGGNNKQTPYLVLESRTKCLKRNKRHYFDVGTEKGKKIEIWYESAKH